MGFGSSTGGGGALSYGTPVSVGTANAAGASTDVARADHVHDLTEATLRTVAGELTASLDVNAQKIIDLATPTNTSDAATKGYVDSVAIGSILYPQTEPPVAASWTVFNSRDSVAIADDAAHGVTFSRAGAVNEDQLTGYRVAISGSPTWEFCLGMSAGFGLAGASQVNGGGIMVTDGTKIMTLRLATSGNTLFLTTDKWTDAANYSTSIGVAPSADWQYMIQQGMPTYWHVVNDGTNLKWYLSTTGRLAQAFECASEAVGAFLGTITHAGIAMRGNDAGGVDRPTNFWAFHYKNA